MLTLPISFTPQPVSATPIILEANVSNSKKMELVLFAKLDTTSAMEFAAQILKDLAQQLPLDVLL